MMVEWISNTFLNMVPLAQALMSVWLLAMIGMPIAAWLWGERARQTGVVVSVILQAATVVTILASAWGIKRVAITGIILLVLSWAAEFIGSHTGLPFGRYHYTSKLQPQLGNVPLLIPLAWWMMLPPAWAVGTALRSTHSGWTLALLSGLAFTAWDLFLDPQMVAWELWEWEQPGRYFGIPWLNFAGWWLVSTIITGVAGPNTLPVAPLLLVYGLTWILETVGQLCFWHLPGPALAGFLGMGALIFSILGKPFPSAPDVHVNAHAPLWIVGGFIAGVIPFSVLIGRWAAGRDIRSVGDGNPGAANVLRASGKGWGIMALLLDMLKGALPVAIAYHCVQLRGAGMWLVAIAPILGHAFSPFLKGKGGKAVAVSGGIWGGLSAGKVTVAGGLALILGKYLLDNDSWAVIVMMGGALLYLCLSGADTLWLQIWLGNLALLVWTHRHGLQHPPRLRCRKPDDVSQEMP